MSSNDLSVSDVCNIGGYPNHARGLPCIELFGYLRLVSYPDAHEPLEYLCDHVADQLRKLVRTTGQGQWREAKQVGHLLSQICQCLDILGLVMLWIL
jgi:hypothetical protein